MTTNFDLYFTQIYEAITRCDMIKLIKYHQNKIRHLAKMMNNYESSPVDVLKYERLKTQAIAEYEELVDKNYKELEDEGLADMVKMFSVTLKDLRRF